MSWNSAVTETYQTSKQSRRSVAVRIGVQHHAAMVGGIDALIDVETNPNLREVSSHGVVEDGRRAGIVVNEMRAWSLSDVFWDSAAWVIECINNAGAPDWTISDASYNSCALMWAAWFQTIGQRPHRSGDPKLWTLISHREVYTIHGGSYPTACPGGINMDRMLAETLAIIDGTTKPKETVMPSLVSVAGSSPQAWTLVGESGKTFTITDKDTADVVRSVLTGGQAFGQQIESVAKMFAQVAPEVNIVFTDAQLKLLAGKIVVPTADQVAEKVIEYQKRPGN